MTQLLLLPIHLVAALVTGDNLTEATTYINPTAISMNVINNNIKDVEIEFSMYNNIFSIDDRIISVVVEDYNMSINNQDCELLFHAFVNSSDRIVIELTLTNGDAQFYNSIEYENSSNGFSFDNSYYTEFNVGIPLNDYYSIYKNAYDKGNNEGYDTGYDTGYDIGSSQGYSEGYEIGKNNGYQVGYNDGYQVGLEDNEEPFSIFRFLERVTATIANLLNTKIFPNITIGTILFIPIILKVVEFIVGWFR